jgi:hypothetical protein
MRGPLEIRIVVFHSLVATFPSNHSVFSSAAKSFFSFRTLLRHPASRKPTWRHLEEGTMPPRSVWQFPPDTLEF